MIKFVESCEHGKPFCKALIIERMFYLSRKKYAYTLTGVQNLSPRISLIYANELKKLVGIREISGLFLSPVGFRKDPAYIRQGLVQFME